MRHILGHPPPPSIRRRLMHATQIALLRTGVTDLYRYLGQPQSLPILMFHSVPRAENANWIAPRNRITTRIFDAQMRFLARRRQVISIEALCDLIHSHRPIPDRTVLITFDDGYLDNLEIVAPILRRYRLQATFYLCSGYVSRGQNQWADMLYSVIRHKHCSLLEFAEGNTFDLSNPYGCNTAFRVISDKLKVIDAEAREELLRQIASQLQFEEKPPRLTLNWGEVRQLVETYPEVTLGIHTSDHRDLLSMDATDAMAEIERSITEFHKEMGAYPEHFSFPYSRATPELAQQLSKFGFRSVMTCEGMIDRTQINSMNLHRFTPPQSLGLLGYYTSGAHPTLSIRLFRRAGF